MTEIKEKLEFLTPTGPTEIHLTEDFPYDAGYLGMWRGSHHIFLKSDQNSLITDREQARLKQRLVHELVHQKYAEVAGIDELLGQEVYEFLTDPGINDLTDEQIAHQVIRTFHNSKQPLSNVTWGLAETVSYLGEKFLGYDNRTMKQRFVEDDTYPQEVKAIIISIGDNIEKKDIPSLLHKIINFSGSQLLKDIEKDRGLRDRFISNPLIFLEFQDNTQ